MTVDVRPAGASPRTGWRLGTRITTVCTSVAVLLAVIAIGSALSAIHTRGQLDTVFNKIAPLRTNAEELEIALLNQETGIRGYALNGADADLGPYRDGLTSEHSLESTLQGLMTGRPALRSQLDQLVTQINGWHAQVAEPVIAKGQTGDRTGAQALINDAARSQFDNVRATLAKLRAAILAVRDQGVSDVQHSTDRIIQLLVAAAALLLLTGVLLALLLRRLVSRPIEVLVSDVEAVAAGDYRHGILDTGPPELVRLSRSIDRMRRRIVSELAEVSEARAGVQQANQQLELQATELTRSNRDLEQFAYVASHDLQEPLRKVASFCQLLQRRYTGQLDERADQYIYFAVDGAQRMQRLINDLLAFSRIGRRTTGFTEVDLDQVVAQNVSNLESTIERTGAEVTWSDLPVVKGEEPLLAALLTNLISNSIKFRRPDEPPKVHLSARQVGDEWEISCQDNGIGIEAEFADKVFVIFQRLHAKEAYPGTGIGLAISKKIVEYHGGHIWLDTTVETGSVIKFTLPVPAPAIQISAAEPAVPDDPEPVTGSPAESPAKEPVP